VLSFVAWQAGQRMGMAKSSTESRANAQSEA
jgi:hypothetical protein